LAFGKKGKKKAFEEMGAGERRIAWRRGRLWGRLCCRTIFRAERTRTQEPDVHWKRSNG